MLHQMVLNATNVAEKIYACKMPFEKDFSRNFVANILPQEFVI